MTKLSLRTEPHFKNQLAFELAFHDLTQRVIDEGLVSEPWRRYAAATSSLRSVREYVAIAGNDKVVVPDSVRAQHMNTCNKLTWGFQEFADKVLRKEVPLGEAMALIIQTSGRILATLEGFGDMVPPQDQKDLWEGALYYRLWRMTRKVVYLKKADQLIFHKKSSWAKSR